MTPLALVFLLFASVSSIQIDTTKIPDGGSEARVEGSRRVTVERDGGKTIVTVQEEERVDTIVLQRTAAGFRVTRSDNGAMRRFLTMNRPAVIVDGMDLEPFLTGGAGERSDVVQPPSRQAPMNAGPSFYVCPKDAAVLRVPNAPHNATYRCPVDGTEMRESVGREKEYYLLD